jgi:hypothetical protein
MRGAALPATLVAITPAFVTAALITATLVASATLATFVAVATEVASVSVLVASFAFEALARTAIPVLARYGSAIRRNWRRAFAGRRGLGPSEILMTLTPAMPMPFALGALTAFARRGFAGGGERRALGRTIRATMPIAIVTRRPPFIRTSAGAPDFDQFGLGWRRASRGCFR